MRKPMMIVLATLALTAAGSGLALAHEKGDGERQQRHQEKRLQHLSEQLGLSDEQRARMQELMVAPTDRKANRDEQRDLHRQIRELDTRASDYNERLDALILQAQQQLAERIRAMQAKRLAMQEILTDEQEEKLADMTHERMEKMEKRGHHGERHHQGDW